jgi:hypothetical protein
MILHCPHESLLRGCKKTCSEMPLGFREPGDDTVRNLKTKASEEGMGEKVEGVASEAGLATKFLFVIVEKEGMSSRGVHGPGHRPVIPGGERGELMAATFVDGLGDS